MYVEPLNVYGVCYAQQGIKIPSGAMVSEWGYWMRVHNMHKGGLIWWHLNMDRFPIRRPSREKPINTAALKCVHVGRNSENSFFIQ